ncbi:MAG: type II toxin-antitoxin system VapC family toxin [Dehalococcoidia bacterium]
MRLFWDTNLFIYFLGNFGTLTESVSSLWERMALRGDNLETSVFTLAEIGVGAPGMTVAERREVQRRVASVAIVWPFDRRAAEVYSDLRRTSNLRAPDAIQLAVAIAAGADYFITNDTRLSRLSFPGAPTITSLAECPI